MGRKIKKKRTWKLPEGLGKAVIFMLVLAALVLGAYLLLPKIGFLGEQPVPNEPHFHP